MGNIITQEKPNTIKNQSPYYYTTTFMQDLISLEEIIFGLSKENIFESISATINLLNNENILAYFNLIFSKIIYSSILSQNKDFKLYIDFMKHLEKEINKSNYKLITGFRDFLLDNDSQESYFILENMIEMELISSDLVMHKSTDYFMHHFPIKTNNNDYGELSKNDFAIHKQLIKEGHNPNQVAKIIRNDDIEKLQEISSQENFNFNQIIKPSLYERCSFINKENVTLIDYAAYFGSIKCFKYLLMNGAKVTNTGKYEVAGGNEEIIHLCEQNHSSFKDTYETAFLLHRNDIFHYLYDNNIEEINIHDYVENIIDLLKINKITNYNIFNFYLKKG